MPDDPPVQPALRPELLRRIDELCDQFESALAAGQAPALEGLLDQVEEPARPRLFRHLLEVEMRHRHQAGRPITATEARDRFAGLGPWVARVLQEVGLDRFDLPATGPDVRPLRLTAGGVFADRYKLREKLGEGGMGTVWVADQTEPVQRRVALKLIKADLPSERLLGRFDQERQALALMDHPNIAKVLDAGVADGMPYFVMELVKGVPFTKYCDEARLTPRERLELFIPVCHAVQHAHQKGVIHRDLKPSNVLVALYDGKPVPKVIDFGLAKATGPRLGDHSVYTEVGMLLGTPEYMAPEQADLNNLDVDTRCDVYSLGVILYELLTGSVPFPAKELRAAGYQEMVRILKEKEPPSPSTKLSASDTLVIVAAARQTEPAKLARLVRGDLDWIVMKALEKERSRRYETANGLARDVQRYLADEPAEAGPPSAGYRLRKVLRKHRRPLATAAAFLALLLAAAAVTTWQAVRLARAEGERADRVAEQGREQAKRSQDVHEALTRATELREQARATGDVGRWAEARATAKRAEALVETGGVEPALVEQVRALLREVDEEAKDRRMVATLEGIRLRQAEVKGRYFDTRGADARYAEAFRAYGVDVAALPVTEAVRRVRRSAVREELLAALDNWWVRAKGETDSGRALLRLVADQSDDSQWRQALRQAVARMDRARLKELAADPESLRQAPSTLDLLGGALGSPGGLYEEAVALLRRAQQRHPADFWINHGLAASLMEIRPPRSDEAIGYYRAALALRPASPAVHLNLGSALYDQKDLAEAAACFRRAVEIDPKLAWAHTRLGNALLDQKDLAGAAASYRKAIEIDPKYAIAYNNLGLALYHQKDLAEAIVCLRKAIELEPDPKNFPARHHAACCAALAAAGQGKDADKLEAAERPRLRRQALDWLRADLAFYARLLEAGKPADHKLVAERMRQWQADKDFRSVRGAALDKLPDDERKAWQKLWADVADLLKKATANK